MYSLVFVLIEEISNTLDSVSTAIQTPDLEFRPKYSDARRNFNSLQSVFGYPDETPSLVFDILQK